MAEAKQYIFEDDWISLAEASMIMHVNKYDLRRKENGRYVVAPNVARIRVGTARNAKILFSLTEIKAWRAEMLRAAKEFEVAPHEQALQPNLGRSFQDLADELKSLQMSPRALAGLGIRVR